MKGGEGPFGGWGGFVGIGKGVGGLGVGGEEEELMIRHGNTGTLNPFTPQPTTHRRHHRRASFSSYPGMLSSLDDFYVMPDLDQRLVMLQTTNVRAVGVDSLGWRGASGCSAWRHSASIQFHPNPSIQFRPSIPVYPRPASFLPNP